MEGCSFWRAPAPSLTGIEVPCCAIVGASDPWSEALDEPNVGSYVDDVSLGVNDAAHQKLHNNS